MWDMYQESGVESFLDPKERPWKPLRRRTNRDTRRQRSIMNRSDFEARLRALKADLSATTANVGCLACETCERATRSTFCVDCKDVTRCHYCRSCRDCMECSHCERASGCRACSHCVDCERCASSAYLVRSTACTGCTYLFGCVGLHEKDFHILNEPYDRETYFALVASLSRESRR